MIGQTISHYKILEKLGSGGMGDVYKAEDLKLGRQVALKFLASHLVSDPEVRKRFEREAKAAASLNHPNICTVHEIDEADGKIFLAMELVKGDSLESHIEKGPLALKESLYIARQAAEGLQEAHANGVVHRDIKPGNIIITPDGRAKILDFGLALLTEGSKLTQLDTTVGTVAYMSPEQSQAAEVDHRTDIWALGCILYEMVCGQRPFQASYDQAVVYSIVNEAHEPVTALRAGLPMELEVLIGKCLEKEASNRYQNAVDLLVDLRTLAEKLKSGRSRVLTSAPVSAELAESPSWSRRLPWALFAAALALAALGWVRRPIEVEPQRSVTRFSFTPESLNASPAGINLTISPDGRHIVFVTEDDHLWVRDLDDEEARRVAEVGPRAFPFWSPDSRWIAYPAEGELRKVSLGRGRAIKICELPINRFTAGAWSPYSDEIIFSDGGPSRLYQVSSGGGVPKLLSLGIAGGTNQDPHFLPGLDDSPAVLLTTGGRGEQRLAIGDLTTGESHPLLEGAYPAYDSSGHILYQTSLRSSGIWAVSFSLASLEVTGSPFLVVPDGVKPSLSVDGTLVYADPVRVSEQLVWIDRSGLKIAAIGQPQDDIAMFDLSSDDQRVLVSGLENGNIDIWLHNTDRPIKQRLTVHKATEADPTWSWQGDEFAFTSNRNGNADIYVAAGQGESEPERVTLGPHPEFANAWSRDGKSIIYVLVSLETRRDIWLARRPDSSGVFATEPFLVTEFDEDQPTLSPDDRLIAYESNRSGQPEVYVRRFPTGDAELLVSTDGGRYPRWGRDELFYIEGDQLISARLAEEQQLTVVSTEKLFRHSFELTHSYEVSSDGQRFVVMEALNSPENLNRAIHVVQNWYEEFRDRE